MRKITFFFVLLFACIATGSKAQETSVSWKKLATFNAEDAISDPVTLQDGQTVVFQHVASGKFLKVNPTTKFIDVTSTTPSADDPEAGLCVFTLKETDEENTFSFESALKGYFIPVVNYNGTPDYFVGDTEIPYTINKTTDDKQFVITSTIADNQGQKGSFDMSNGTKFVGWHGEGGNSRYRIIPVTVSEEEAKLIEFTYNYTLNGVSVGTENKSGRLGSAFPAVSHVSGYITMTAPEGTISEESEGQTYNISVTVAEDFPFEYSAAYGNDLKWYLLKFSNPQKPRYIQYDRNATEDKYAVTEEYTADVCYLWAFIGNPFEGFRLVNKATGEKKLYAADLSNAKYPLMDENNATVWMAIKSTRSGFDGCFGLKASTAEEYLNNYGGNGYLSLWKDSQNQDDGSNITVIKAPEEFNIPIVKEDIQSILNQHNGKTFGTGLGKYTWSDAGAAVAAAENAVVKEGVTLEELKECLTNLQNVTADLNQPAAGKFYRFKSATNDNRRMTSTVAGDRMQMETNGNNAAPTVFYLDEYSHLVALSNGLCIGKFKVNDTAKSWQCLLASDDDASTVVFKESGTIGKYNICVNDGNRYLYNANSTVDCGGSDAGDGYRWTIEEVTWLPVPINTEVGFGTLYSPVELMQSNGRVKAYTGTISGDYIKLTEIEGNIPANTPVVLEYVTGAEDGCVYLQVASNETTAGDDNCFSGKILAESYSGSGINTLQKIDDIVGFYNYTGNTLYGFKAYIENQGANVRGFALKFGETTGIDGINAEQKADEVLYDLNGRIALYPASGIYVTASGKKVLVK